MKARKNPTLKSGSNVAANSKPAAIHSSRRDFFSTLKGVFSSLSIPVNPSWFGYSSNNDPCHENEQVLSKSIRNETINTPNGGECMSQISGNSVGTFRRLQSDESHESSSNMRCDSILRSLHRADLQRSISLKRPRNVLGYTGEPMPFSENAQSLNGLSTEDEATSTSLRDYHKGSKMAKKYHPDGSFSSRICCRLQNSPTCTAKNDYKKSLNRSMPVMSASKHHLLSLPHRPITNAALSDKHHDSSLLNDHLNGHSEKSFGEFGSSSISSVQDRYTFRPAPSLFDTSFVSESNDADASITRADSQDRSINRSDCRNSSSCVGSSSRYSSDNAILAALASLPKNRKKVNFGTSSLSTNISMADTSDTGISTDGEAIRSIIREELDRLHSRIKNDFDSDVTADSTSEPSSNRQSNSTTNTRWTCPSCFYLIDPGLSTCPICKCSRGSHVITRPIETPLNIPATQLSTEKDEFSSNFVPTKPLVDMTVKSSDISISTSKSNILPKAITSQDSPLFASGSTSSGQIGSTSTTMAMQSSFTPVTVVSQGTVECTEISTGAIKSFTSTTAGSSVIFGSFPKAINSRPTTISQSPVSTSELASLPATTTSNFTFTFKPLTTLVTSNSKETTGPTFSFLKSAAQPGPSQSLTSTVSQESKPSSPLFGSSVFSSTNSTLSNPTSKSQCPSAEASNLSGNSIFTNKPTLISSTQESAPVPKSISTSAFPSSTFSFKPQTTTVATSSSKESCTFSFLKPTTQENSLTPSTLSLSQSASQASSLFGGSVFSLSKSTPISSMSTVSSTLGSSYIFGSSINTSNSALPSTSSSLMSTTPLTSSPVNTTSNFTFTFKPSTTLVTSNSQQTTGPTFSFLKPTAKPELSQSPISGVSQDSKQLSSLFGSSVFSLANSSIKSNPSSTTASSLVSIQNQFSLFGKSSSTDAISYAKTSSSTLFNSGTNSTSLNNGTESVSKPTNLSLDNTLNSQTTTLPSIFQFGASPKKTSASFSLTTITPRLDDLTATTVASTLSPNITIDNSTIPLASINSFQSNLFGNTATALSSATIPPVSSLFKFGGNGLTINEPMSSTGTTTTPSFNASFTGQTEPSSTFAVPAAPPMFTFGSNALASPSSSALPGPSFSSTNPAIGDSNLNLQSNPFSVDPNEIASRKTKHPRKQLGRK